jgi:hypothetical protein
MNQKGKFENIKKGLNATATNNPAFVRYAMPRMKAGLNGTFGNGN